MVAAAGCKMVDIMSQTNELQDKLHANTEYFVGKMKAAGFDIKPTESAIRFEGSAGKEAHVFVSLPYCVIWALANRPAMPFTSTSLLRHLLS